MTAVPGLPEIVGARFGGALTTIVNGASCALTCPSLTLIVTFANVPTLLTVGVPCSRPVLAVNVAQVGRFAMLYVKVSPSASAPVGVNENCVPTVAAVGGVPEIVGARFGAALTTIVNGASCALACPSLTLIVTFANVPALLAVGVPCSRPVLAVNVAQVGRFAMLYVSVSPSASAPVGVNENCVPTVAVVGGAPEIVGAAFDADTVIANAGSGVDAVPSLTLMTMLL
jgi:hypothetical protein